ncbi:hypothetical protein NIES593_01100 [Hydrococcus rivularis NIES-593]|uniref:Uncharacterized protein n=2 Tax=Hydrococcus TaxID=1616833 RepID=A0A1U7HSY0_9CYAN|nr:hypothetical protein NIES593_01100 [Hydrococcus rivularis NIES-593]
MLMSSQNNSDWERKFQDVEVEVDPDSSPSSVNSTNASGEIENAFNRIKVWFDGLPPAGRLIVTLVALTIAFSIVSTIFQIVTSLLSTAVFAVILYLVYRFLTTSRSPNQ